MKISRTITFRRLLEFVEYTRHIVTCILLLPNESWKYHEPNDILRGILWISQTQYCRLYSTNSRSRLNITNPMTHWEVSSVNITKRISQTQYVVYIPRTQGVVSMSRTQWHIKIDTLRGILWISRTQHCRSRGYRKWVMRFSRTVTFRRLLEFVKYTQHIEFVRIHTGFSVE